MLGKRLVGRRVILREMLKMKRTGGGGTGLHRDKEVIIATQFICNEHELPF